MISWSSALLLLLYLGSNPSYVAIAAPNKCFSDRDELKSAVNAYIGEDNCTANDQCAVAQTYGWPIGTWCVSEVTDMTELFKGNKTFNEDLSGWDVSSVTTMKGMFSSARSFNSDVSSWDVSSVIEMEQLFFSAEAFNRDISPWTVSSVINMKGMFEETTAFNIGLSSWEDYF